MDPATLTKEVMNALIPIAPYLGTAGTAIATKVGEDVYQKGKALYEAIAARFAKEPDQKASTALQAFVDDPDMGSTVEIKLLRLIQNDATFADTLRQILQTGPQMTIEASDEASVRKNKMKNTQDHGSQQIKASGKSMVEENEMNITYE
jgi:hypothetical protein